MDEKITLDYIKQMKSDFITPAIAAPILGCTPNALRSEAHESPSNLGFPVTVIRTRVRIPRLPFIKFIERGVI